jgi:hypothetical protein
MIDRVILGDNQFFGISHMSEAKGMERMRRFEDLGAIIAVLDAAYGQGIRGFTFTTHERVKLLCDHFRDHSPRYADLRLYPVLPYAQKYAHLVNEKGMVGAVKDVLLTDNRASQVVTMLLRGSMVALTKDPMEVMKLLVDAELKMFHGLNVPVVFLQNNVADLLLGLGIKEFFVEFSRYIQTKYKARAGFMTLNLPRMVDFLLAAGIEDPVVCAAINKIGFQMNPDIASYEQTLRNRPFQGMAMSVMAAGAVPAQEAFAYATGLPNLKAIVFGASNRGNIEQTLALLGQQGWR